LDRLVFLPCRQSPHKKERPTASDQQRLQMLRLAIASEPRFEVDDFELTQPPPSYTWMTIRKMKAQLPPHSELFLLIGLDQWQHIESWQHPSRLAEDVTFLVVGRDGHPQQKEGFRALFLSGDHPASSSQIREKLALKQSPDWIPANVLAFIEKKGLYSARR